MAVPLAFRVPNAPPTFVGRSGELRAIAAAAKRGPVVVLCGAGGLGKTALATAAVKKAFGRVPRAVMVSARAGEPLAQLLVDVVRALGHPAPREDADLAMLAIDLAERERAVVVLDDLHHALPEATALLVAAARYARRAKWIATTRVEPSAPELDGQILRLEPLAERHLAALAKLVDPALTRAQAAEVAKRAEGSPWRAREIAGRGERASESAQAVLATLSAVERPISKDALAATVDEDVRALVADLVRRGLVEAVAGGFRIHEAARALVGEQAAPDRAIAALAAGGDADALEALRLALKTKNEARALAICEASFDELLHAGHATTLWKLVSSREGPRWNSYKLRAAMRLADVKITTLLDEPPKDALRDRLLWVRALHVESRASDAYEAADELFAAARKGGDARIAFWAAIERAMAAHNHFGPARGLELLGDAAPQDDATRAIATALSAFWQAESGRIDDAVRTLERSPHKAVLETPLADAILGGPLDFFVRYYRMAAFMECGHLGRAHAELTAGTGDLDVDDQLRASYVQLDGIANLSIARGKLDDAERILARLLRSAPQREHATTYHTIARLLDVERRIAAGAFGDASRDLERLLEETRSSNALVHAWCFDTRERLRVIHAERGEAPAPEGELPLGAVARSVLALRRALARARWGLQHDVPAAIDVEGSIVHALVLAVDAILAKKDAGGHARRAVDLAVTHGWGVRECEARELLACALFLGGDVRGALAEARVMGKLAQAMTSRRFELESRVLVALFDDPRPDVATLEEAAASADVSPVAARRARAILGDAVSLDAIDDRVVALARGDAELVRVRVDHRRGWGLDARRGVVWLPDGKRVSFQRHALLAKVLEVLAVQNGAASFEDLARLVWQRKTFHPLNDGTRIRVTLHRLRALVETDPQRPERVVLANSSYVLGGEPFTLVRAK